MPTRKKISPAERRYMNHLRIESLRVGSVYEAKLARERRKELKRVLAIAMNYDDPEKVPDVLADNLSEGYLTDWWQGLWMAAGVPRAQTTARDLQQAKAAGDTDMWKATLRSYASQRAGENIVSVTGTWKDSLVRLVRGLLPASTMASTHGSVPLPTRLRKWSAPRKPLPMQRQLRHPRPRR